MAGPLTGMKVVEMAGIGPSPMAAMLLADLGATVLRIDRRQPVQLGRPRPFRYNLSFRNRRAIALDLKDARAVAAVLALVGQADALIEGFRPGTMERLGLGPEPCLAANPRLIYGRMTGWGQEGPLSHAAGHDINYIALPGALAAIGRAGQPPSIPMNLVGDFGGGSLYLAFGIMCAMFEVQRSGKGQVVDAAIVDGVASMMISYCGLTAGGMVGPRGTNPTDSGSHFYDSYECADGRWISVGAIEGKFYDELVKLVGLDPAGLSPQWDKAGWPDAKRKFTDLFKTRTRDQWCDLLEGTDACFAPVLEVGEAVAHPHLAARGTYVEVDGIAQPAPAPRFSRTVPDMPSPPEAAALETVEAALEGWLPPARIGELKAAGLFG